MTTPYDGPPGTPQPERPGTGPNDHPELQPFGQPPTGPALPSDTAERDAELTPAPTAIPAAVPATTTPAPGFDEHGRVKTSRTGGIWVGLIGTAVFLILLIIFIAQNSRRVSLHFFGWHGQFSLALTILLSAVIGILVVAIPGTVRILQLRRALRKNGPGRD